MIIKMGATHEPIIGEAKRLERFVNAINEDIENQIEELISSANEKKTSMLDVANDTFLNEAYKRIQDNVKRVEAKYVKLVATTQLDCKKAVLLEREKLVTKVFDNVKIRLIDFCKTPKYVKYLAKIINETKDLSGAQICLRSEDMKLTGDIEKELSKKCSFKEDDSIKLGGLFIYYQDKGMAVDRTFDIALGEERKGFHKFFADS